MICTPAYFPTSLISQFVQKFSDTYVSFQLFSAYISPPPSCLSKAAHVFSLYVETMLSYITCQNVVLFIVFILLLSVCLLFYHVYLLCIYYYSSRKLYPPLRQKPSLSCSHLHTSPGKVLLEGPN